MTLASEKVFTTVRQITDRHSTLPGHSTKSYRLKGPWHTSLRTFVVTAAGLLCLGLIVYSLNTRQLDPKGCRMAWMHPSYHQLGEFDTEHTRFASKYSLYLYRDSGVDRDTKVRQSGGLGQKIGRENRCSKVPWLVLRFLHCRFAFLSA